jgi:hypothetical protein
LILGAAIVVCVIAGLPFGDHPQPQPTSTVEAPHS